MVFSKPAIQELQKEYPHAPDGQYGVGGVGHVLQIRVSVHLDEVRSGSGRVGTHFEALDELVLKILILAPMLSNMILSFEGVRVS